MIPQLIQNTKVTYQLTAIRYLLINVDLRVTLVPFDATIKVTIYTLITTLISTKPKNSDKTHEQYVPVPNAVCIAKMAWWLVCYNCHCPDCCLCRFEKRKYQNRIKRNLEIWKQGWKHFNLQNVPACHADQGIVHGYAKICVAETIPTSQLHTAHCSVQTHTPEDNKNHNEDGEDTQLTSIIITILFIGTYTPE